MTDNEMDLGYTEEVQRLIDLGWALRCGHCRRRLNTDYAPKAHRVWSDLSGRCFAGLIAEENDAHGIDFALDGVSTSFYADPRETTASHLILLDDGVPRPEVGDTVHSVCGETYVQRVVPTDEDPTFACVECVRIIGDQRNRLLGAFGGVARIVNEHARPIFTETPSLTEDGWHIPLRRRRS